jgi:hypothetical protein
MMQQQQSNMQVMPMMILGPRETAIHRLHLDLNLVVTDGTSEHSVISLLSDPNFGTFVSDIDSNLDADWNIVSRHIRIPELLKPVLIRFIQENIDIINNM